ncbi:hypothetical protein EW145_g32 [Phellinidium pouzarii]|uniref:GFO/IDH/MocA-like oxidoreductase domain-containing protein n=1 Tax=Phellinidium pouzarii TaxID=167371 RepID=A0A4S4LKI5_9AGAM|nr:hypothetical protein EW145_g32 [Phellinidium pouzarii]
MRPTTNTLNAVCMLTNMCCEPSSSLVHLGDLVEFESHYDRYRNELKGTWKDNKLPGAGQVYDLGTHLIDQVVSLFGKPEKVTGFVDNVRGIGDPGVDDSFTIILRYPKIEQRKYAMNVILRANILSVRDAQLRFVVRGTKGSFVKYGLDVQEDQLKTMPFPLSTKRQWADHKDALAYVELFYNLAGVIRKGDELKVKWEEVTTVLEIIELAQVPNQVELL